MDVNASGLQQTVAELRERDVRAEAMGVDLSSPDECQKVVPAAVSAFGRLDVAGVLFLGETPDMPPERVEKVLAVNLKAPFFLIQAAIPHLLETEGAVVNVSSTAGFVGQAYSAVYCASKAGLTHMTKSLAMEYMHKPICESACNVDPVRG